MLDPISAVTPRAVLRTAAHLPHIMPFMFGAAVALNACAEQSGNDPEIASASNAIVYVTMREGAPPTFDEELAACMRYGGNGP